MTMTNFNRHNLPRTIPASVKREVRQRCGFGCVRCGIAFYQYEHFDPDFADATEHDANGITLLCPNCNAERHRGTLARSTVAEANQKPRCLQQGFANYTYNFGCAPLEVIVAGSSHINCEKIITINGTEVLSTRPPETPGNPFRFSGLFAAETGEVTLRIVDNEWKVGGDNWDVECVGNKTTIRNGPEKISLVLCVEPPKRLLIERINMQFEGVYLVGDGETLGISFDGRNWNKFSGNTSINCPSVIELNNR